jgi:hypothetical protein
MILAVPRDVRESLAVVRLRCPTGIALGMSGIIQRKVY